MKKVSIKDLNLTNQRIFLRVDFNVPIDENGKITSDVRIRASLPTIEYIINDSGIAILASHLGRPKGRDLKHSLRPVAQRLSELVNQPVAFADDCIGERAERVINQAKPGDIILLENLRFYPEEEKNDRRFAQSLAKLANLYVNDAFGAAHRAHASVAEIAKFFENPAAGLLMEKEIEYLSRITETPEHPFVAIIGGSKISDKLAVIKNLLKKVDVLLLGGGLVFNFLKAQGYGIGKSLWEPELLDEARNLLCESKIRLPQDLVVAEDKREDVATITVPASEIPEGLKGLDIGLDAVKDYRRNILKAKTIVWAGPMGVFEIDKFAFGTKEVANSVVEATENGAISVVGGGDTVAALDKFGLTNKISHVSTGGGASLEFLEGKELPGIVALKDR